MAQEMQNFAAEVTLLINFLKNKDRFPPALCFSVM
jgi:hypothetical protein